MSSTLSREVDCLSSFTFAAKDSVEGGADVLARYVIREAQITDLKTCIILNSFIHNLNFIAGNYADKPGGRVLSEDKLPEEQRDSIKLARELMLKDNSL